MKYVNLWVPRWIHSAVMECAILFLKDMEDVYKWCNEGKLYNRYGDCRAYNEDHCI